MPKKKNLLDWYRTMLVIRYFEEKVEKLFSRGLITGTAHPCIGQEAIAVGACSALRKKDYVTSNHRGHGHFIACGGDPSRMMAELFGKATGYSGGRGGSQLMADYSLGFIGGNGITGGSIPIATGVALSSKLKKTSRVTICFFGDGASNQGTFHESLNMAGLWNLPVVFICENNMYAMSNHVSNSTTVPDIAIRAKSYGIKSKIVDGNDILAVQSVVSEACTHARSLKGPTLIECKTYRLSGHSRGDQRTYRTRDEERKYWQKDPVKRFHKTLMKENILTPEINKRTKKEARQIISDAVKFARTSKDPNLATIGKGVFA
ncbi:MAG: thiamine pyrophosphate-dependent dehydrogenase E1 component subunit alpha [Kiritimatiellae bacterium]|nr:thiamine pyrophosphate-dependent dehydrogenase E1 component subunit alpha [Kiritimatiellia bacterium]